MKKRNIALAALVVVLGAVALTYGTAPKKFSITAPCLPDPAATIAGLPSGGTFTGTGNCYTTHGITITKPVTINGGKFYDPDNSVPPQTTHGANQLAPIIKIVGTNHVTIENVHLFGADYDGTYHAPLVNNAGVDVLDSSAITLTNVRTTDTFGDGLELWTANPSTGHGDSYVHVDHFTAVNAGRVGFSILWAQHVTMDHVYGKSFSFETDSPPQIASGDVGISNCSFVSMINIPNAIDGPISFDHCTGSAMIGIILTNTGPLYPVTISDSQIAQAANYAGTPPAGIYVRSGMLNLLNDTFTRLPAPKTTGLAYLIAGGSELTLSHTTFVKPFGTHDASSQVSVAP